MKRLLIIVIIAIAVALGILIFASIYQPKITPGEVITPTIQPITPAPTPSPTPEIKIQEDATHENMLYLEFHPLLEILTTSQYNYVMSSIDGFFSGMFQSNIRYYSISQFLNENDHLLANKFFFKDDDEIAVPFDKFKEVFVDDDTEYLLILNKDSILVNEDDYTFSVNLNIDGQNVTSFEFIVKKETLKIKIQ